MTTLQESKKPNKESLEKLAQSTKRWLESPEAAQELSAAVSAVAKRADELQAARRMDDASRLRRRITI